MEMKIGKENQDFETIPMGTKGSKKILIKLSASQIKIK